MKIVQFSNGKYGVRTYWCFGWFFKSATPGYHWRDEKYVKDYCMFDTLESARNVTIAPKKPKKLTHKVVEKA